MDPGVGHQVGLELVQVDIKGAVEAQRGGDGGHDLPVEVGVARALDVEVAAADVVDRFVVHHEAAVAVLEGGVGAQRGVVRLHHGGQLAVGLDAWRRE